MRRVKGYGRMYKFEPMKYETNENHIQYEVIIGERITRKVIFEKKGYPENHNLVWPFQYECNYIEKNLVFKRTRRLQDNRQILFEKTFNPTAEEAASILDFF